MLVHNMASLVVAMEKNIWLLWKKYIVAMETTRKTQKIGGRIDTRFELLGSGVGENGREINFSCNFGSLPSPWPTQRC